MKNQNSLNSFWNKPTTTDFIAGLYLGIFIGLTIAAVLFDLLLPSIVGMRTVEGKQGKQDSHQQYRQ